MQPPTEDGSLPRASCALFTDLYELTMAQAFWRSGMSDRATFSLFFRGYPANRSHTTWLQPASR